ncbi:MAG TPA: GGDEF domain-containing protein [Gemmatimonadales bacterium]|nr:GGDEF domain-containing protein [Gemmatimonadales bacterium]
MSRAEERPSGIDRRAGLERRSGIDRRAEPRRTDEGHRQLSHRIGVGNAGQRAGRETEPGGLPLRRLFPYAQFNEREAADRSVAIEAHRRELSSRLGRNIGLSVAALDYLLHISHDLVDPTIVEQEALEVLERRSVTDPLTGLFNRHHFAATLKREVARCLRYSARLSLLLMDVDQLKAVNDRCGHQAGDQVLGRVAGAIRNSLRGADVACRYGGDEFAIILPETDAGAGRLVAERIRTEVAAALGEEIAPGASSKVTVSGGLAELPRAATSEAQLLAAADQALYRAKRCGGNAVADAVGNAAPSTHA